MDLSSGSDLGLQAPGFSQALNCGGNMDTQDGGGIPTSGLRLETTCCNPWRYCPHGPAQTLGSALLCVHRDVCAQTQAPDCLKKPKNLLGVREHHEPTHPLPIQEPHVQAKCPSVPFLREECAAQRGGEHQTARERCGEVKLGCINHPHPPTA